jgi:hypothetical protein
VCSSWNGMDPYGRVVRSHMELPWGGRNARLRTPDGLQLTLFSEL